MLTSSGPSCVVAPRNVCMVRCASGVTMMSDRAVGRPPDEGRRLVGDADRAHVVREDVAELVLGDLADVGRRSAERGETRDRVPRRSARDLDAGPIVEYSRSAVSVSMSFIAPFGSLCFSERRRLPGRSRRRWRCRYR